MYITRVLCIILVFFFVEQAFSFPLPPVSILKPGTTVFEPKAPIGELRCLDKEKNQRKIEEWEGQTLVIYLWSSWCSDCLPDLFACNQMAKQLAKKSIAFIAISEDFKPSDQVFSWVKEKKWDDLFVLHDNKRWLYNQFNLKNLPVLLVVDDQSVVHTMVTGSIRWDHPETLSWLLSFQRKIETPVLRQDNQDKGSPL